MHTIQELISVLESSAPLAYQESYDNSGLLVGDRTKKISKALLTLDCTEAVVDEAIEAGCELIIAHHPILFSSIKSLTGKNYIERVLLKAIKHDIGLYACHTNLDNIELGVNKKIAEKLGLQHIKILVPMKDTLRQLYFYVPPSHASKVLEALHSAGAGSIGNYSDCSFATEGIGSFKPIQNAQPFIGELNQLQQEQELKIEVIFQKHLEANVLGALRTMHPYEEIAYGIVSLANENQTLGAGLVGELSEEMDELEFLNRVKINMNTTCIRHTALLGKKIKKVAVCGGSGSFLLKHAIQHHADAYITGDFKYHEFFDADSKILVADIGHYESEQFTNEIFYEILSKKFPTFAFLLTSVHTNPVNYY